MLRHYPELPADEVDRQGQSWVFCDVGSCTAEAEVTAESRTYSEGPRTITEQYAEMPEGWETTDPGRNALNGAAQFCGSHANRVVRPPDDAEVVVDSADPAPEPDSA